MTARNAKLFGAEPRASGKHAGTVGGRVGFIADGVDLFRRERAHHVERFRYVQFARFPVGSATVIVPNAVGQIAVLLDLGKQDPFAQNFVKKTTAPYKYPRIVDFKDSLPKTISGKIMRKDIK